MVMGMKRTSYPAAAAIVAGLILCSCGPYNYYNEIQIVNEDPGALVLYKDGELLPESWAGRYSTSDASLRLEARVLDGARARFGHWTFREGGTYGGSGDTDAVVTVYPDAYHRVVSARADWETNGPAWWLAAGILAWSTDRDGSPALRLWDAAEPTVSTRPFAASSMEDRAPDLSLALVRNEADDSVYLWKASTLTPVAAYGGAADVSRAFFLDGGAVMTYGGGGFRVTDPGTLATLLERPAMGLPTEWNPAILWFETGDGSASLYAWAPGDAGVSLLSDRADEPRFNRVPSPSADLVAMAWADAAAGAVIRVTDGHGAQLLHEPGPWDPDDLSWDQSGMVLRARKIGVNVSWTFPGAAYAEDPLPSAPLARALQPDPNEAVDPVSPDGLYEFAWVLDGNTPVNDLVVTGPGGTQTSVTTLPVQEAAE